MLLSKKTGHPVKMVMTRGEVLRATGPTSGSTIRCKMGATKDGKLVAAEVWMAYEAGAFPGSPVGAGAMTIIAPYDIPNIHDRRLRRRRQPAQDRGLSRAGSDQRRDGFRDDHRRTGREVRHRSVRIPPHERRQGRHAADRGTAFQADRLYRDASRRSRTARITSPSSKGRIAAAAWPRASGSTSACSPRQWSISIPMAPPAS